MLIVYMSITGNVRRFVRRLQMDSFELKQSNIETSVSDNFVVIVPTYDDEVNDVIRDFLSYENNIDKLVGFVGSGNKNFNQDYVWCAKKLSFEYNKPLLLDFEFSGTDEDLINFERGVKIFENART